jgi:hypothetical protein
MEIMQDAMAMLHQQIRVLASIVDRW